jgi:hypothetical protein
MTFPSLARVWHVLLNHCSIAYTGDRTLSHRHNALHRYLNEQPDRPKPCVVCCRALATGLLHPRRVAGI